MSALPTPNLLTIACIAISSAALTACNENGTTVANSPPVNTSSPVFSPDTVAINVAEDSSGIVYTASASDADGDELSYSIDGDDASKFSIGTNSGALQFISPPDYENPDDIDTDRVYQLTISASDGLSKDHMSLSVNITDANDPPVFIAGAIDINVAEDSTEVIYTASASDADGNELRYSIDGDDASKFSIGTSSGELQFISPPDYENPDDVNMDRVYQLTISASDGLSKGHMSLSVNITDDNDPPVATPATDQSAIMGSLVSLDGSASNDSDGTITGYSWQLVDPDTELELSGAGQAQASFIAPAVTSATSYTLRLTVIDDDQASNSAEVSISVAPIIIPSDFSAEAGENNSTLSWSVQSQELVYNLYRSSDPDCDLANYSNCPNPALYLDASSGIVDSDTAAGSTYYYWLEAQSGALAAYSAVPQAAMPYAYKDNPKCFLETFNDEDLIQAQEYNANLPIDQLCRIYQSYVGSEALISVERITSAIGHNAQIHPHNIGQMVQPRDGLIVDPERFINDLAVDLAISKELGKDTAWFIVGPEVPFFDAYLHDPYVGLDGSDTINADMIALYQQAMQMIRDNNMIAISAFTYDATCDAIETVEGYERRKFVLNTFLREMWDYADVMALAEFSEAFWSCLDDEDVGVFWAPPGGDVLATRVRSTMGRIPLDIDEDLAKRFLFIFHSSEITRGWTEAESSMQPGAYNIKSFSYYAHGADLTKDDIFSDLDQYLANMRAFFPLADMLQGEGGSASNGSDYCEDSSHNGDIYSQANIILWQMQHAFANGYGHLSWQNTPIQSNDMREAYPHWDDCSFGHHSPLDFDYNPKPAYYTIQEAIAEHKAAQAQ